MDYFILKTVIRGSVHLCLLKGENGGYLYKPVYSCQGICGKRL